MCTLVKLVRGQKVWELGELMPGMGMPKQNPNEFLSELGGLLAWCAAWMEDGMISHNHISKKETILLIVPERGSANGRMEPITHALSWITFLAPWGVGPRASSCPWLCNFKEHHHQQLLGTQLTLA